MTLQNIITEARGKYDREHPCLNPTCDDNGTIAVAGKDGEPEPEQCEYCYRVRFPEIADYEEQITRAYRAGELAGIERAKAELNVLDTCLEGLRVDDPMGYGNQRFMCSDVVKRIKETKEKIISALREGITKETYPPNT